MPFISKSQIAAFEQCPKRLWLQRHRPDAADRPGEATDRLAMGQQVGTIARALHDTGMLVEFGPDRASATEATANLVQLDPPRPLFEATFERDGVMVRLDLLIPDGAGKWDIKEVKASTSAKPHYLSDLATQIWVLEGSSLAVGGAFLQLIDNQFNYAGDGDYSGLFKDQDVVELIAPLVAERGTLVAEAFRIIDGDEPAREIGDHCEKPYPCEFRSYCRRGLVQPEWPISLLPQSGSKLAEKWAEHGIVELTALSEEQLEKPLHRLVHRATVSGEAFHDCAAAVAATAEWAMPLAYLDFETISFAVPRWKDSRPFEQIPFQYSLHVEHAAGKLDHHEFLDLSGSDPRRACAEALLRDVPLTGAIIAYNASFERTCIKSLAARFDDLSPALLKLVERMVDLMPVAKACWYHRDQRGSWSIKKLLPTIAPHLSYAELEVSDGGAAQLAFQAAIDPGTDTARKAEIDRNLREYCRLDTLAMVEAHRRLVGKSTRAPG